MYFQKIAAGICFTLAFASVLLFVWFRIPFADDFITQKNGHLILDRNSKVLFFDTSEADEYVLPAASVEEVAPAFVNAVLLLEDENFYRHNGIDFAAVLRALQQNIRSQKVVSGASTISLQLAKNLLGNQQRTWLHKAQEALYALRLEAQFGKEELLAMWANRAPFGSNIVGINAASQYYFHKSPRDLSLAQATYLAGIPNNPDRYSPLKHPNAALERGRDILSHLRTKGFITAADAELASDEDLVIYERPPQIAAPHFVMRIIADGLKKDIIKTSLDVGLQNQIESIVKRHLDFLGGHNARNAAVIVIENASGAIRAYIGNADFFDAKTAGQVDVLRSYRQVGSTLKPFLYYLAFRDLGWTADTIVLDEPTGFRTAIGTDFAPKNFDLTYRGEMTVRDALAESRNIPAVATLAAIGESKLFALFDALDIIPLQTAADAGLSAALGAAEIRPLDLARGFTILARDGKSLQLCSIEPCLPQLGKTILEPNLALEITNILADNVARIDAFGEESALTFDFPVAAKTGTSRNFRDNYAVGYTPIFTVLVWVGNSDGSAMQEVSGIAGAGPIFHEAIKTVTRTSSPQKFADPQPRLETTNIVAPLRILAPLAGAVFSLDAARLPTTQKIRFTTNKPATFVLDGAILGSGDEILWTPTVGEHILRVADSDNNNAEATFVVHE